MPHSLILRKRHISPSLPRLATKPDEICGLIRARAQVGFGYPESMRSSRFRCVVGGGALLALTLQWSCTVNPVTGENQLDLMGEAQEIQLGAQLYPSYTEQSLGTVSDAALQDYVNQIGGSLAEVGHRPQLDWQYNAVNDPIVNAYALPGGKISITRGLLARMETEDALAGVLGHETGHVTARHASRAYTRQMLTQLALLGGMVYMESQDVRNRQLYAMGAMVGAQALLAKYSRDQERQSDHLGVDYMVAAGYNPRGMVELMQVLAAQHDREPNVVERMFASHPLTANRIAAAEARIAQLPPDVLDRPMRSKTYHQKTKHVRETREAYDALGKAQRHLAQEEDDAAVSALRPAVDSWPREGVLRVFLAAAEFQRGHKKQALTQASRAANDARSVFMVQAMAGQILLEEKRYQEALKPLNRSREILTDVPLVELMRGQAYEGVKDRTQAVEAYRNAARLDPQGEIGLAAQKRLQALGAL